MLMGDVRAEGLLRALDPQVRDGLTEQQESAIRRAARQDSWGSHPVDLRFSLPLFFGRYYVALIAGGERRSGARRGVERARHPLTGMANLLVLGVILGTFGLAAVGVALLVRGATFF